MQCMLCGQPTPPSHVVVRGANGRPAGEVCGWHQLREVIMDVRDQFQLDLTLVPEGERTPAAIEA